MRRLLRLLKWTFALLLGLPLLAYLGLLLINWNDQPPSAEALEMQRILAERPVPADEDNAYVYLLGILAPEHMSPLQRGLERLNWARNITSSTSEANAAWPEEPQREELVDPAKYRLPSAQYFINRCNTHHSGCLPDFSNNSATVQDWLDSEPILLERYLALLELPETFAPSDVLDIRFSLPSYQHAIDGQRLLMAHAWQLATQNRNETALGLLEKDLVFWRMMQRDADTLLERLIAVTAIRQHFQWARAVLVASAQTQADAAVPTSWRTSFTEHDRALHRMLAGEWLYSDSVARVIERGQALPWAYEPLDPIFQIPRSFRTQLFQPQASSNILANKLALISNRLNIQPGHAGRAIQGLKLEMQGMNEESSSMGSLYNPVGRWANRRADHEEFVRHIPRIFDLESIRRASLLLVSAVAERIPEERMAEYVAGHELKDPYSEEPFGWDAEKGALLVPLLQQDEPLALPLR